MDEDRIYPIRHVTKAIKLTELAEVLGFTHIQAVSLHCDNEGIPIAIVVTGTEEVKEEEK